MKIESIKKYLKSYSIVNRRKTTINNAFASALAPFDNYDLVRLKNAMEFLGQADLENLICVYCGNFAETWDHLVGLVKNSELNGNGHQIGNLIPCCKSCNSKKGNQDWRTFIRKTIFDSEKSIQLEEKLDSYHQQFSTSLDLSWSRTNSPQLWEQYSVIKQKIFDLMTQADQIANQLRLEIKMYGSNPNTSEH